MAKIDTDPPREGGEKFSIAWYRQELLDLIHIGNEAQKNNDDDWKFVEQILADLQRTLDPNILKKQGEARLELARAGIGKIKTICNGDPRALFPEAKLIIHENTGTTLADYPDASRTDLSDDQKADLVSIFIRELNEGKLLRTFSNLAAKGMTAEQFIKEIKPLIDEQLKRFHEGDVSPDQSLPAEEKQRRLTWLDSLGGKARNLIFTGIITALAGGTIIGIFPKAYEWLSSRQEKDEVSVTLPPEAKNYSYGIVQEGAKAGEAEPLADWKEFSNDSLEVYNFGHAKLGIAMPDGSWLYVPDVKGFSGGDIMFNDQTMNQAYVFPPNGKSNKEWRKVRYPVQELAKRKCSLGQDGLWRNKQGEVFTVLQAGHLLQLAQGKKPAQFLPFNEAKMKPIAELAKYYQLPAGLEKIDTSIPKNFVDTTQQASLSGIKFELSYSSYDNTVAGIPLYPPGYKPMIPQANVADLAAAEQELFARYSRHLGVGDAYRSKQVQAFLRDNMPRGMVAKPSDKAPHMLGAMDIFITDAEYIEIGPQFAFAPFGGTGEQTGKTYGVPETWQQAQAQNWTQENFEVWDAARDILAEHGFVIPPAKGEFWHVERQH